MCLFLRDKQPFSASLGSLSLYSSPVTLDKVFINTLFSLLMLYTSVILIHNIELPHALTFWIIRTKINLVKMSQSRFGGLLYS